MGAGGKTLSPGKHPASFCPLTCSFVELVLHPAPSLTPSSPSSSLPHLLSHFSRSHQCSLSSPSLLGPCLCSQANLSHLASFITPKLSDLWLYWDLPKQLETPLPCLTLTLKHPAPPRPLAAPRCCFAQGSFSSVAPAASPAPPCSEQHLAQGTVGLWLNSAHDTDSTEGIWSLSAGLRPALLPCFPSERPASPQHELTAAGSTAGRSQLRVFSREELAQGSSRAQTAARQAERKAAQVQGSGDYYRNTQVCARST